MLDRDERAIAEVPAFRSGFELFDLTVQLGPGLVPWVSAVSRLGHVHGIPRRDSGVPPIDDLLDSVYDYVDAVRFADLDPEPSLARDLGHLVFGEPSVLELFQATRGAAADRGREVLVRILASPHLAVLPWELLPDPAQRRSATDRRYLALAPDACVTRLARGRTYPVRSERLEPPLNLLIVVSSPIARDPADDSLAFDIYEEKRSLMAELLPLVDTGLLHVDVEEQPSLENLRRRIGAQRRGYHILHYLGHALPDRLILEDEQGRRDDQSGARFTEILRLSPDLRLAVFAGCETARAPQDPVASDAAATTGWHDLFSLADRAVQESCPMVVGMQAVLPFRTERLFTRFFYQGLVSGYSVTAAMRLARGATRGDRHVGGQLLDWSVPVLFLGGSEPGPLMDRSAVGKPPNHPPRHVLRVGLRQTETRFFARDIPLRQAIDVLAGKALERVLVVRGPAGVGKTALIDRALEELEGPISILYLRLRDLIPELDLEASELAAEPLLAALASLQRDAILQRLCVSVADLLNREQRPQDAARTTPDWRWLVEDITARHFVIAIDEVDLLVAIEEALLQQLVPHWLTPTHEAASRVCGSGGDLPYLLGRFIETLRDPSAGRNGDLSNPFIQRLDEFRDMLPQRHLGATAQRAIAAAAQRILDPVQPGTGAIPPDAITAGLKTIAGVVDSLGDALQSIAERRSPARLAIVGSEVPEGLVRVRSEWVFEIRLGHLMWSETFRWIRRNLPGLLRYGEEYLLTLWSQLGTDLERWEELERRVLLSTSSDAKLDEFAKKIAPRRQAPRATDAGEVRPRGKRPLRIAVAGPYLAGPDAVARAVTRLAALHNLGGRVIPDATDQTGSLAILIDEPSPFLDRGHATESALVEWLNRVLRHDPDVILLDYGARVKPEDLDATPDRQLLRTLRHRCLIIAAGANAAVKSEFAGFVQRPAAYNEVLSVGPMLDNGHLPPYAIWWPEIRKPDFFMNDQLLGTPLEEALNRARVPTHTPDSPYGPGTHGSSYAALNAVVTAILVWATIPDRSPRAVRRILENAAKPLGDSAAPDAKGLVLVDALNEARRELVRETLRSGPCSFQALAAISGLDPAVALGTLTELEEREPPAVRRLTRGRLERYELTNL